MTGRRHLRVVPAPPPAAADELEQEFVRLVESVAGAWVEVAEASAAILVWADAFRRAQSFDTEKLREALAKTDLDTFFGHIKFSKAGNNIAKPMVLRQIQDGKYAVVAPTKVAAQPIEFPRKVGE